MEKPGSAFRWGTVAAGEYRLDYAEAGPSAPAATIVSLPGSAGIEMSRAKDELARTYRVIEINPPGWGGKDDLAHPMSQKELGQLLAEAAGKLVKEGRFYLIGTSMGGANALFVAEAMPDRIAGVIHEGSMAPAQPEDLRSPPMTDEQRRAMLEAMADDKGAAYPIPPVHPKKPWATAEYIQQQMANRGKMFRFVNADFSAESGIAAVRSHKIPVLAMLGDEDEILNLNQAKSYAAALPGARFVEIPNGRHDLQNTATEAFVREVEAFIGAR